ncbi:MotA/TolQ/ExbB proton channel family protein [Patulibacter brassicae]|uniref:MotA/TolQ/ExbB proton channel family protein n=1 Tax=Patulibacter brassicae TaxID=1705717 RepID=A0ABU4VND1_9ACTN|nr:MotA/TolQ/ExbB proton channel family protein [Patulibacter brassicae]MDX8153356.1 MotA/TolQ/ExbB proton channel family protein [Patulibacter brassicae]
MPLAASDPITDALSSFAEALETPVHALALVLLLVLALELGRGGVEAWRRMRRGRGRLVDVATTALREPQRGRELARDVASPIAGRALERMADAVGTGDPRGSEPALAEYELAVQRRLDRTRVLVRAGPAVGLMGTLIPLAPGIASLGEGDIAGLASDLRTAFAATVVGILVGTTSFVLTLWRTRMYTEDLTALEQAVAALDADGRAPKRITEAVGEHAT